MTSSHNRMVCLRGCARLCWRHKARLCAIMCAAVCIAHRTLLLCGIAHIDALQLPRTRKAPIGRRDSLAVYMLPGLQDIWCISKVSGREPLSLRQVITLVGYKVLAPTTRPTLTDDVGHFPLFGAINHDWSRPLRRTTIASHCVLLK